MRLTDEQSNQVVSDVVEFVHSIRTITDGKKKSISYAQADAFVGALRFLESVNAEKCAIDSEVKSYLQKLKGISNL